jgi:hypothetical protein
MYAAIFKFNPHRDEAGRFSTRSSTSFFSPNVGEGFSVSQGNSRTGSYEQSKYRKVSNTIDKMLGIQGDMSNAVGAWSDGGENSLMSEYKRTPYEKVRVATAMKGLLAQQKGVITFNRDPKGPSRLHTLSDIPFDNAADISAALVEGGMPYHTLVKRGKKFDAVIFEDKSTKAVRTQVSLFAEATGANLTQQRGNGALLGSWDSRADGIAQYKKVIDKYLSSKPKEKAAWESTLATHKFRAAKMLATLGF